MSRQMRYFKFDPSNFKGLNLNFVVEHFLGATQDMLNLVVKLQSSAVGIGIPKIRVKILHFFELWESIFFIIHQKELSYFTRFS
jgi:hypothetical protein